MSQDAIVLIIVAVCAALVAWGIVRRVRGKKGGYGCGCGGTVRTGGRTGGDGCCGCSSDSCGDKKE